MAGRPSKIFDHISPLDIKEPRKPKWKHWRHGRKRMDAAALSEKRRQAGRGNVGRGRTCQVGSTEADDAAKWAIAKWRAEELVEEWMDDDLLPDLSGVLVPGSDQDIAKQVLTEAVKIALGPVDRKTKMDAIKTVLTFTKQKPASKVEAKVDSLEAWLSDVNKDGAD